MSSVGVIPSGAFLHKINIRHDGKLPRSIFMKNFARKVALVFALCLVCVSFAAARKGKGSAARQIVGKVSVSRTASADSTTKTADLLNGSTVSITPRVRCRQGEVLLHQVRLHQRRQRKERLRLAQRQEARRQFRVRRMVADSCREEERHDFDRRRQLFSANQVAPAEREAARPQRFRGRAALSSARICPAAESFRNGKNQKKFDFLKKAYYAVFQKSL